MILRYLTSPRKHIQGHRYQDPQLTANPGRTQTHGQGHYTEGLIRDLSRNMACLWGTSGLGQVPPSPHPYLHQRSVGIRDFSKNDSPLGLLFRQSLYQVGSSSPMSGFMTLFNSWQQGRGDGRTSHRRVVLYFPLSCRCLSHFPPKPTNSFNY